MGPRIAAYAVRALPALAALALATPAPDLPGQAQPPPAQRARGRVITVGATIRDSLGTRDGLLPAESTYAQQWRLVGTAGETVTIDVGSDAFDAYAFLLGPGFEGAPPQDDDSGGHCNARLTVRLPQTGDYDIVVTSTNKFATGAYTLSVTAGPSPKSLSRCDR